MFFSNWFAIASNATTAMICGSITILLATQFRRDSKAQALIRLMFNLAFLSFSVVMMRLMASQGLTIHAMFAASTILTGSLPISLFLFTHDYFDVWTRWRRIHVWAALVLLLLVTVALILQLVLNIPLLNVPDSIYIATNGEVMYAYGPWVMLSIPFIVIDEALLGSTLYTLLRLHNQKKVALSKQVMFGVGVLVTGMILVPIPGIEHYAFEQLFYAVGALTLIEPVLRERLFEPLSQANRALGQRAEQINLITQVGLIANASGNLEELFYTVTDAVQQKFGHEQVALTLHNADGQVVTQATTPNDVDPALQTALTIPFDVELNERHELLHGTLTLYNRHALPVWVAEERAQIFGILGQQISSAIRNIYHVETAQRADQAKTQFISYVSHELRNSVSEVLAISSGMLDEPVEYGNQTIPDVFQPDMRLLIITGGHLKQLLNDIVDWGQIESGHMQVTLSDIDPLPILQAALDNAAHVAAPAVQVCAEISPTLPIVHADEIRLRQILRNLLRNAGKFTTKGKITIGARPEGDFVRIFVADTGRGMSQEEQVRLFQPYSQGSAQIQAEFGGSGLGLNISQQLVHLHGGQIWVESTFGQGTTVSFTIPIAARHQEPSGSA